eukprot:scaffold2593_cov170-Amphora_coffeaeformis.AAC.5
MMMKMMIQCLFLGMLIATGVNAFAPPTTSSSTTMTNQRRTQALYAADERTYIMVSGHRDKKAKRMDNHLLLGLIDEPTNTTMPKCQPNADQINQARSMTCGDTSWSRGEKQKYQRKEPTTPTVLDVVQKLLLRVVDTCYRLVACLSLTHARFPSTCI